MNASQRRTMRKRLGQSGLQGSRPWSPWSKILVTETRGIGEAPGTLNGWHFGIPINNWNDPMGTMGDLVAGTAQKIQDRHPIHHNDAIADGYDMVQVLSCRLKVEIYWNITQDVTSSRMTWGYAFSDAFTSPFTHAAGSVSTGERLNMLSDPRWTTGSMIATANEKAIVINVNIPSILEYGKLFHHGSAVDGLLAYGAGMVSHAIADSSSATNAPAVPLFCHFVLFNNSGLATLISSTKVNASSIQKVRIMRNMTTADLNISPDIHS